MIGELREVPVDPTRDEFLIGSAPSPQTQVQLQYPNVAPVHVAVRRAAFGLEATDLTVRDAIRRPVATPLRVNITITTVLAGGFSNPARVSESGGVDLLMLDESTLRAAEILRPVPTADDDLFASERAIVAVAHGQLLVLRGSRCSEVAAVAQALHQTSVHAPYPFIAVDEPPVDEYGSSGSVQRRRLVPFSSM